MTFFFWTAFAVIVYTFIGYAILLLVLVKIKRKFGKVVKIHQSTEVPTCCVLIAAYNEESFIREKILNTLSLDYPANYLKVIVVADGSTDKTTNIVKEYSNVLLLFEESRLGKVHAINRAMQYIDSEIVVFTDANTYLNRSALREICNHYQDSNVGGVAGEKRIFIDKHADASAAGESLYWRYESII